ncbi:MAG: heme lyase CcmF/NrfE family subunit [Alphaproteobacteria bacterium]|nr:heme lyase CcmF/NrfE family subunit [Alphaproteobacteria bacterium]MDE2074504.1 heme lyase CcmF/NrfE family subunit [Alphaproteobacteria bacterium]MDE2351411.1 heme lyase CcmF/NrfE family subunit [Alphaproteobacteria bacterium]
MIAEIGLFALILALFVAGVQACVPLLGAAQGDAAWMKVDRPAAVTQFGLVAIAFGALIWLHITSDFSVLNVVQNGHTDKPLLYKITGVWGSHEGSMLLWTFILVLYGLAVSIFGRDLPPALRARALAVQGMIGVGFLLYILLTSNPFLRVDPPPLNGNGLNPLLQDPGLALHPPFLYLGYVGFSMAFSFAIAALIEGRVDAAWARWVRPWTLLAWCALTLGVGLGAWWSYYTLGWGGYWAWDPVENASLMPWLAGTALLHSSIVAEKRDTMKSWTIFLAIITFSLSLLGTFLVRSGILTSVHSFATDPARGMFILTLLAAVTGGSLALYAIRAPALKGTGLFTAVSREGSLLFNNVVLSTAAGTVLLGTLYPIFMDALGLGKVSVGPPYFNLVLTPLMAPLVMLMAVGPLLSWKRGDLKSALARLKFAGIATFITIVLTWLVAGVSTRSLLASLGLGLGAWLLAGTLAEWGGRVKLFRAPFAESLRRAFHLPRSAYGLTLGHVGMALVLIGIAGSQAWQSEYLKVMHPGDVASLAGYQIKFEGLDAVRGPNYVATRADFVATENGHFVATMQPERRIYTAPPRPLSTVAIHTNFISDLYTVLGDPDNKGGFIVHIFHNPLVPWLFVGVLLMALGGVVALTDRHHRVGAPVRRTVPRIPRPALRLVAAGVVVTEEPKPSHGWSTMVPLIAFAVLAGFFIWRLHLASKGDTPNLIPSVMINRPAPQFDLPALTAGQPDFKTADLKGQVTLVNFFASWCQPCRAEHPLLSEVRAAGIRLIGIDYKDKPADARGWLADLGDPYRAVVTDEQGRTGINFGVYGVPESYLIDKNGVIRFKQTGPLTEKIIREQIVPLVEKLNR